MNNEAFLALVRLGIGNAATVSLPDRIDWNEVCPHTKDEEVYIFGNPPYVGSKVQSKEQKQDIEIVCSSNKRYKDLDYICNWFIKGCHYISNSSAKLAFVSTNSITQGQQVALLWETTHNRYLSDFF